jgi:hypothetical protein
MTMHLDHPALTMTGRMRSVRRKFASADAARKARELEAEWLSRQQAWAKTLPKVPTRIAATRATLSPQYPPGREPNRIPSRPDTPGAVASRAADKVYTGTAMKGIGVLHKSNSVPIFTDDEAVDIAHMRR